MDDARAPIPFDLPMVLPIRNTSLIEHNNKFSLCTSSFEATLYYIVLPYEVKPFCGKCGAN